MLLSLSDQRGSHHGHRRRAAHHAARPDPDAQSRLHCTALGCLADGTSAVSAPEQPFSRAFCTLQGAGPCGIRAESWTCTTWAALLATMCAWFKACYNGRARCMPHSVDARQLNGKTSLCLHSCAQMYARDTQQNRACNLACIPVPSMGSQRVQHTARQIRTIDRASAHAQGCARGRHSVDRLRIGGEHDALHVARRVVVHVHLHLVGLHDRAGEQERQVGPRPGRRARGLAQQACRRRPRRPGAGAGLLRPPQVVVRAWRRMGVET